MPQLIPFPFMQLQDPPLSEDVDICGVLEDSKVRPLNLKSPPKRELLISRSHLPL